MHCQILIWKCFINVFCVMKFLGKWVIAILQLVKVVMNFLEGTQAIVNRMTNIRRNCKDYYLTCVKKKLDYMILEKIFLAKIIF